MHKLAIPFAIAAAVVMAAPAFAHDHGRRHGHDRYYYDGPARVYRSDVYVYAPPPVVRREVIVYDAPPPPPRRVCWDEPVGGREVAYRDSNADGTLLGALIGGALGNTIGKGDGRKAATIAGAVVGGAIGNDADRRHVAYAYEPEVVRRCEWR